MDTKRIWLFAALCFNLTAQGDFTDRIIAAPDTASLTQLLDSNLSAITPELFESCRKAARTQLDKRETAESMREYKIALEIAKRLKSDGMTAAATQGIAVCFRRMGQHRQALALYQESLPLAVSSGDRTLEAQYYRGIGNCQRYLGEFAQAIEADEHSVAINRELNIPAELGGSLFNLGDDYLNTGDIRRAAELYEESQRVGHNTVPEMFVTSNLGVVANLLGNYEAAISYLEKSMALAQKVNDSDHLAMGLRNIGDSYEGLADYDKALDSYNRALPLAVQAHDPDLQASVLQGRAALYVELNRRTMALSDMQAALALAAQVDSGDTKAINLSQLASMELTMGQTESGCGHAEQAVAISLHFPSPDVKWQAYDALGVCQVQKKEPADARKAFEQAIDAIETWRSMAGGNESDTPRFLEARIAPYHHLLKLDLDQGLREPAFSLAERAKARQLLDVVRGGKTEIAGGMTPAERAEEHRLGSHISQLDQQATAAVEPKAHAEVQNRLEHAQREMEAFRVRLYASHPALAAKRGEAVPITLTQSAQLLPDAHTALIEFSSTESELYVFLIARGTSGKPILRSHVIHWPRLDLAKETDAFLTQLSARDLSYRVAAQHLYNRLLGPLASDLQSSTLLVFVPDGPLWNLPFQALITPAGHYLIEDKTLFYAPSLTYLRESRRLRIAAPASTHRLLALGDPDSGNLPETAREVKEIVNLYGTETSEAFTGVNALKASWVREAPKYRILHLATHGFLNAKNPMYSYLLFSGKTGSDKVLEAREVLQLNLHSDLVVLSACETGRGRVAIGEGLVGMSWAFLLAGAPTAVVSQWKVDSVSTTRLMIAMHNSLKPVLASQNLPGRARSLQQAALSLMQNPEYRHPNYWAGFVMIGDGY